MKKTFQVLADELKKKHGGVYADVESPYAASIVFEFNMTVDNFICDVGRMLIGL
jgi:hypothetical protein